MSIEEPLFLEFMKNMFSKHGSDFNVIKEKFYTTYYSSPKDRDKISVLGHFYYFICTPDKTDKKEVREELQIVGITSLIDALMGDIEYKDPFVYFESTYKGKNSIEDFAKFKKEYHDKYSVNKKIVKYFNKYVSVEETENILESIKILKKKGEDEKSLKNLEELAKFLYQMRSDFVHCAEMTCFCPEYAFSSMLKIGKDYYIVSVNIATILELFEKSFVTFWQKKYDLLLVTERLIQGSKNLV
ncbi:MAG: hypothetical protein WC694_03675 [Candidatus Paceibacterota bacterium]|jgi:hypothetical protein